MSNVIPVRILQQVRALLKQTKASGCTEAEAANAAATAQRLLARWGLGLLDLQADEAEPDLRPVIAEHEVEITPYRARWLGQLMGAVASSHGCTSFWRGSSAGYRHLVVGTERGALVSKALYLCLAETIKDRGQALVPDDLDSGEARTWHNSFRLGAVSTISFRLKKAREKLKVDLMAQQDGAPVDSGVVEGSSSTALVRVSRALTALEATEMALDNHMRALKVRHIGHNSNKDQEAFQLGQVEGRTISLSHQVLRSG